MRPIVAAVFAAVAIAAAPAADPKAPPKIEPGMRVQSKYASKYYPGVIKEVKDQYTYVIRSDGTNFDEKVEAWRLRSEDGTDFLDLIQDPQRMAARAKDKQTGDAYFVGTWNCSPGVRINITEVELRKAENLKVEKVEYCLATWSELLVINADGTYAHNLEGKKQTRKGKWKADPEEKGGILLEDGHWLGGDLKVKREELGTLDIRSTRGGYFLKAEVVPEPTKGEKK